MAGGSVNWLHYTMAESWKGMFMTPLDEGTITRDMYSKRAPNGNVQHDNSADSTVIPQVSSNNTPSPIINSAAISPEHLFRSGSPQWERETLQLILSKHFPHERMHVPDDTVDNSRLSPSDSPHQPRAALPLRNHIRPTLSGSQLRTQSDSSGNTSSHSPPYRIKKTVRNHSRGQGKRATATVKKNKLGEHELREREKAALTRQNKLLVASVSELKMEILTLKREMSVNACCKRLDAN
ncbi:hypothetical protein M426DRAFT_316673 [Hypoxylon sp. CI-4A]|nr:hypothetical protein M426DRAFT_316673 [Hypoxylon sp. CI-4A]